MDDQDGDGSAWDEASYVLELRVGPEATEIAIVRQSRSSAGDGTVQDAWSSRIVDPDAARMVFDLLSERTAAVEGWGRMAHLLGPRFLDGVLDSVILSATACRSVEPPEAHQLSGNGSELRRSDGTIRMRLRWEDEAKYIVARRNGRSFLVLTGKSNVATRRIWDWVRWQGREYRHWFRLAERDGLSVAVEEITQGMLAAERDALERGSAPDPHRPLRYWRPWTWQRGLDPEREGPTEAFG